MSRRSRKDIRKVKIETKTRKLLVKRIWTRDLWIMWQDRDLTEENTYRIK